MGSMTQDPAVATDSLVSFRNSQGIEARGTLMRLSRNVVVLEVYNPYSIVQLSEVLRDVQIRRRDRTIYTGRAVVNNLVSTGLLLIVSATLIDPWSDLIDLNPGPELREEVRGFVSQWEQGNDRLRPSYELIVSKAHNFLEELSRWLEHGEAVAGIKDDGTTEQLVKEFVADVDAMVAPKLDELIDEFDRQARWIPKEEAHVHKAYVQRELHPLMMCSPFLHRTFTKPLGYAGDYEMVNMILNDPLQGSSTYARIINAVFLRTGIAQGHRNRIDRLVEYLETETRRAVQEGRQLRVLNIGCGPAAEIERFVRLSTLSDRCHIELLDFNEETLRYTQNRVQAAIGEQHRQTQVKFVHRSIHHLLKEASNQSPRDSPAYDFVYCAGLFDYLSDRICKRLVALFCDWTAPGGCVVVTNVHSGHSFEGTMDHLLDWNLLLRDEADMLALSADQRRANVQTDATGTNLFLEIRKAALGP